MWLTATRAVRGLLRSVIHNARAFLRPVLFSGNTGESKVYCVATFKSDWLACAFSNFAFAVASFLERASRSFATVGGILTFAS